MSEINAWDDLIDALQPGETIEAVAFGLDEHRKTEIMPLAPVGVVMTPAEARPHLQRMALDFFWEAQPVVVWTDRRVVFVHEYDNALSLAAVPRNPTGSEPITYSGFVPWWSP